MNWLYGRPHLSWRCGRVAVEVMNSLLMLVSAWCAVLDVHTSLNSMVGNNLASSSLPAPPSPALLCTTWCTLAALESQHSDALFSMAMVDLCSLFSVIDKADLDKLFFSQQAIVLTPVSADTVQNMNAMMNGQNDNHTGTF